MRAKQPKLESKKMKKEREPVEPAMQILIIWGILESKTKSYDTKVTDSCVCRHHNCPMLLCQDLILEKYKRVSKQNSSHNDLLQNSNLFVNSPNLEYDDPVLNSENGTISEHAERQRFMEAIRRIVHVSE